MAHKFTSLRYAVEKLQEAEYFLGGIAEAQGIEFQFNLNAFLSAARNVTFVMQKSLASVNGFAEWYEARRLEMHVDATMRYFVELRNFSQKQGPVGYIGGATLDGRWTYRFINAPEVVPPELIGRDLAECCASHLAKLSSLVVKCSEDFPFHACPAAAVSEEGMAALGYTFEDIERALGLPKGYTNVPGIPVVERLRILREEFEPLEVDELRRLADGKFAKDGTAIEFHGTGGHDLIDDVAASIRARQETAGANSLNLRDVFLDTIAQRIIRSR